MIDESAYSFTDEFFVLEKTVEIRVHMEGVARAIRIEALNHPASRMYYPRAYAQDCYKLQPSYPQTRGRFDREPEDGNIWKDFEVPWIGSDSADGALTRALEFLRGKCD